jgi:stage II sporulation protein AA (anti-sigma F factor antagonist)
LSHQSLSVPVFDIRVHAEPSCTRLTVRGELDLATAPALAEAVAERRAAGVHRLLIDLSELEFIDSTGLRLLLDVSRLAGLELRIVPGAPVVQRALELSGLATVLPIVAAAR